MILPSLPLRAGRGEPIAQGPAQERKVRGWRKMPRSEVGRGSVKPRSCDCYIEKSIREQSHVSGDRIERRSECSGRGSLLKGEEHISKNSVAIPFLNIIENYK